MQTETHKYVFQVLPNINPDWDIFIIDTSLCIHFISSHLIQKLKFDEHEILGQNLKDFMPTAFHENSNLFKKKAFNNITFEIKTRNQKLVTLLCNGFIEDADGEKYAILFWNDVSRYSTFEKRYLSKEIELNTLIYKISHDLRGPVASAKGLVNLLQVENTDKKLNQYIEYIKSTFNKLDSKVNSLTNVANSPLADNHYFSEINIQELVHNSLTHISKNYDVLDIVFDFNINESEPFRTYEFALLAVFNHMFIYAIENKKPNKKMTINLAVSTDEGCLSIYLKDNMTSTITDTFDQIFSPFYTNETFPNSALNLYTIKKSIEFLNGQIHLKTSIDGTEFTIKIPIY